MLVVLLFSHVDWRVVNWEWCIIIVIGGGPQGEHFQRLRGTTKTTMQLAVVAPPLTSARLAISVGERTL